jgi:hypothetical protein
MKIIYRNQLPGKPPTENRIEGWVAALVGFLIFAGLIALVILLIPFLLIGILGFFGFILILMVAGWVYLGFKIGFRNLWDMTRFMFGAGFGPDPWQTRRERIRKEWENRTKGKDGEWRK